MEEEDEEDAHVTLSDVGQTAFPAPPSSITPATRPRPDHSLPTWRLAHVGSSLCLLLSPVAAATNRHYSQHSALSVYRGVQCTEVGKRVPHTSSRGLYRCSLTQL